MINIHSVNGYMMLHSWRLGEFLKELELTEGRATGIPTIQRHLRLNGSPAATIETDEGRTYFMIDIPCHPAFLSQVVSQDNPIDKEALMYSLSQVVSQVEDVDMNLLCEVLMALREPHNMKDLMQRFGQTNRTRFRNLCLNPLLQADLIALTIPDKPNSKLQQYVITEKGMHYVH